MKTFACFDADFGNAVAPRFWFHLITLSRGFVKNKPRIETSILVSQIY
ncbi:MAG: hypothetical protein AVDCRST_MAG74-2209 [uncultured Pyrinomonadaceae bacterium]|uniref:Uncharacterized protein n=1 Tax=uncultured Pyrinomonadaceae bacterium TaxID=2283094 RepID=A0A6J4PCS9_9BACT|nr:MAG: hypothetical protein AVDCRST_MAG74-2209 [uncultured Pyrinomonadaceae bacterium]